MGMGPVDTLMHKRVADLDFDKNPNGPVLDEASDKGNSPNPIGKPIARKSPTRKSAKAPILSGVSTAAQL